MSSKLKDKVCETRRKKTHTRTLSCGSACCETESLPSRCLCRRLLAFSGFPETAKARKITEIVKIVEVVEKPRPKELVKVYNIVKSHRADITDSEAWRVSEVILEESLKRNLDPMLVLAVIEVESRFQYSAISPVGARGIMQIMPDTGKFLTRHSGPRTWLAAGRLPARIPRRSDLEHPHGRLLFARSQKTISQSQPRLDRLQRRTVGVAKPLGE